MTEDRLRTLFRESVPALPEPADRVAEVGRRVRRTRARAAGTAVAVAVSAIAVGAAVTLPDDTPVAPAAAADCTNPETLLRIAEGLRATAPARFPESFTDVEITSEAVVVFRKPSTAFDEWAAQECVTLVDALHSAPELRALRDRVEADRDYWKGRGIVLNTVAVDPDGTIRIGVNEEDVERAQKEIVARYGDVRITAISDAPTGHGVPPGSANLPLPAR